MSPTIHDVAKKANVSISTVSRVVNNPQAVRKDKREHVLRVIEELGYEPNPFASGLRDKKTMTIVAMIPDIANPFYAEMFRGIEDIARSHRYNVIICNTDRREDRFLEYMRYFKKKKPDGLIFASDPVTETAFQSFQDLGIPIVLAATDGAQWDLPSVKIDDFQASYDAAAFLIKNGHRHIGLISGPPDDPIAGLPRCEGFHSALRDFSLAASGDHVVYGDFHFDSGYAAMRQLYAKLPEVTAVFAASDAMALGAMKFLQERGIDVPRLVSVVGFDNLEMSRMVTPSLTTVAQPIYQIGQQSADLLFRWIDTLEKPPGTLLRHEILVRESVWNRR